MELKCLHENMVGIYKYYCFNLKLANEQTIFGELIRKMLTICCEQIF